MRNKRIGFLSTWGINRGLPTVTLYYMTCLNHNFDIYLLKQGLNDIEERFQPMSEQITIDEVDSYHVDPAAFREWIERYELDAVVFNEYNQWQVQNPSLVEVAKEMGVVTFGYLVLERFDEEQAKEYDYILCPTKSYKKLMRKMKIRNWVYAPFALDLERYEPKYVKPEENFLFVHIGGMGGVLNRKNTEEVVKAFIELDDENTTLYVLSQKPLDLPKRDNIFYMTEDLHEDQLEAILKDAHCVLNPSKWETIGIPILESLAYGTPVITTDIPPMNEFVQPGTNGYLCRAKSTTYDGISIEVAEVNSSEIKNRMKSIMQPYIYPMLARNSRAFVEQNFNSQEVCVEVNDVFLNSLKDKNGS